MEEIIVEWRVRGIRGATTVVENSPNLIREAVLELLTEIKTHNQFLSEDIVCVFFTATPDINAVFPAAIARQIPGWDLVPLLDLQQMSVPGSLPHCIRVLIQINSTKSQSAMVHCYLRNAGKLRPDLKKASFI